MRLVFISLALAFGVTSASAQSTTRIETRPYYGAVTTVEKGVRITRVLPPHDRIIIAPQGTPVAVNVGDTHRHGAVQSNSVNVNGNASRVDGRNGTIINGR